MPQVDQQLPAQGERPLQTKLFKEFKGVYTKSDRSAMPDDHFYNLENLMPIGAANVHSVPGISASLVNYVSDVIYWSVYVQVLTVPYQISLSTNGKVFAYNWNTQVNTQINVGNLLSGAGSRVTQFMNLYALFGDSSGIWKWDGTTFAKITGTGVPTTAVDICTAMGRVWVASGRLLQCTAAYDGTSTTDPTNATAWQTANGSAFANFTDPTLTGSITRLTGQNGFLFVAGATCLWGVTNVYVPAGASPPTPVMTIYNIQAINGTDQPASMVPYGNHMLFANRYGAWVTDGQSAEQMSEDIDGTWQYLSFNPTISAGQCVVNNKLCAAFLLQRLNDPNFGSNTVIGMYFDKKWWFANLGTVTFIATAIINSVPTLVGFIGNQMYSLFTNAATFPNGIAQTPLWGMDDELSIKEVIRAGARAVFFSTGQVTLSVDGLASSMPVSSTISNTFTFVGASGAPITFVGAGPITWVTLNQYSLYNGYSPGVFSGSVGMTLSTLNVNLQLCLMALDYKKGARWTQQ